MSEKEDNLLENFHRSRIEYITSINNCLEFCNKLSKIEDNDNNNNIDNNNNNTSIIKEENILKKLQELLCTFENCDIKYENAINKIMLESAKNYVQEEADKNIQKESENEERSRESDMKMFEEFREKLSKILSKESS